MQPPVTVTYWTFAFFMIFANAVATVAVSFV